MGKDKISFNVGDMVFAKVRGYPAWPARISSVVDPRPATLKYNVYFFGTAETAVVLGKDICSYADNKDKLGKPVKRKFFKEGMEEIEREITKIENGEESTVGIFSSEESAELLKKSVRKSKKLDDNQSEITEDEPQNPKPKKRKREGDENEGDGEIASKKKRISVKDKGEETPETTTKSEHISRSGRVIKPKKFLYDEEIEDPETKPRSKGVTTSPAVAALSPVVTPATPSTEPPATIMSSPEETNEKDEKEVKEAKEVKETKKENAVKKPSPKALENVKSPPKTPEKKLVDMGRIMWAKTKNGEMVQIKLDVDRPAKFKDNRSRLMWERATDINAKRLKADIESGEITREDIKLQLKPTEEQKAQMTEEQLNDLKKKRIIERKRGKLRWLKLETRLVDIDVLIKASLQRSKVDIDNALTLMDELINMPLDPLMLKKHPQVVDTTKKLRQYVGNISEWDFTPEEKKTFEAKAYKIRQKADILFNKYTALFAVPENSNFWNVFLESVNEFAQLTENMPRERVYGLIVDPTSPYFKDVCQEEKEEEEFKLKLKDVEIENTDKKADEITTTEDDVKLDEATEQ